MTPETAEALLQSLRWDVDQQIINHDGEFVWLGPYLNTAGGRIGITDCCFVGKECAHHASLAAQL